MADQNAQGGGFNPVGTAEGMGVGMVANRLSGGIPFMPSFYNSQYSNPGEGFANSEASGLLRGEKRAVGRYAGRNIGKIAGGALGSALGPFGTVIGGMVGGWLGGKLGNQVAGSIGNSHGPTATVVAGGNTYDANGGLLSTGTGNNSGGPISAFGPYSSGYQSQWADSPDTGPVMPSFGNYSDQFTGGEGMQDSAPGGGYNYSGGGFSPSGGYAGLGNMGSLGSQSQLSGSTIGANSVFGGVYMVNPPTGSGHPIVRGDEITPSQN